MATIHLEFVSQDHQVFSGDVRSILAQGGDGQLGILPGHAPLMTVLNAGEIRVQREGDEDLFFAVSGGWMEVLPDRVTILARTAERSDEIDLSRAEAARARAEEMLAEGAPRDEKAGLELALRRSQIRLRVARRKRDRRSSAGREDVEDAVE